jgi:DNA-binding MarR family transcriptional regulator
MCQAMAYPDFDNCLVQMNVAFRALISGPDAVLETRGLGRAHHRTLFTMRRAGAIAVGDLARTLDVSVQALHKTLRPLLRQKLVKAAPSPEDGRVRQLLLTPSGVALENKLSGMQRKVFAAVAHSLGAEALDVWSSGMVEIARQSSLAFGSKEREREPAPRTPRDERSGTARK